MKKDALIVSLLAAIITVPAIVNGEAIAKMSSVNNAASLETEETTPLPSSTTPSLISADATFTSELAPLTIAEYEAITEAETWAETETEAPEYDDVQNWIPDVVLEYATKYSTIVVVDISDQHVYMCIDGKVIADADCVSGDLYSSPTPTGLYSIWYKRSNFYMKGSYYTAYAAFFNGEIALHDADDWRTEYGGCIYQGGGSHGCVNLPRWFAEIVYNNTCEGTPVYVF